MDTSKITRYKEYWEKSTPMNFGVEKWSYERKREFRYELQDYMHKVFNFEAYRGKRVLEVGCGSGIDACEFARNGAIVTAVDITDNAVELTKELAREAGVPIFVRKCNGYTLPFATGTFDLVYSFGVLHHIDHVETVLEEIWRVLKFDGAVNAMLYNRDSLLFAYSILHQHMLNNPDLNLRTLTADNVLKQTGNWSERNEGCPYTRAYTSEEAKELFEKFFTNVNVEAHYNVIDTKEQRKVKLGIDDKFGLGWHLIIKGNK